MRQRHNLISNKLSFVVSAVTGESHDVIAGPGIGEEVFSFAVKVIANDGVGRIQNVLG